MSKNYDLSHVEIILCRVSHSGNIGSVARAMKVMGLNRLCLVNPLCLPDDLSYAMATHAGDIISNLIIVNNLQDALINSKRSIAFSARNRDFTRQVSYVRDIFYQLKSEFTIKEKISLVFGNEQHGLNSQELNLCELLAVIPTNNHQYSSLNLSQAVQIACYELSNIFTTAIDNDLDSDNFLKKDIVSWHDIIYLFEKINQILEKSNFYKHDHISSIKTTLKTILYKSNLTRDELNLLHGIMKHILTKVSS